MSQNEKQEYGQRYDMDILRAIPNIKRQHEVFSSYYNWCVENRVAPFLSDFLTDSAGWGGTPLAYIGNAEQERIQYGGEPLKFRLKVRCDQWGNKPVKGDKVTHLIPTLQWRKASPSDETRAKQIGNYDKKYKMPIEYMVDEKGCILVPFQSAAFFLNSFGVHSYSMEPLTKKREYSEEPVKVDKTKSEMKHIHYWRFEEITDEQYKSLPILKGHTDK
jgi:hypothetical protein